jgi:hypothetical protein
MAARTVRTVEGLTTGTDFSTRDTVAVETPAHFAPLTIDIAKLPRASNS